MTNVKKHKRRNATDKCKHNKCYRILPINALKRSSQTMNDDTHKCNKTQRGKKYYPQMQ